MAREPVRSTEQLEHARQRGADDADYHVLEARLARLRGDNVKAASASATALSKQPGLGQAWLVQVETADPEQLPRLIERMEATEGTSSYQQTLLYYALADAHRALGNIKATALALKQANSLQVGHLQCSGWQYNAGTEEQNHRKTLAQYNQGGAVAALEHGQPTPILIVGMPRSGTTLMEKILAKCW